MDTMSIKLDADVYNSMEAKKPRYLSTSGFIALVLEIHDKGEVAGLTLPPLQSPHHQPTLNEERIEREKEGLNESEANVHKGRKGERKETKTKRYQFVVPDVLDWCQGDLTTFWKEGRKKNAPKTEHAANYLFNQIEKIEKDFGRHTALNQIAQATANGWTSITHANAVRYASNIANDKQKQEDDNLHPSRKVYKASDFYGDKGPTTNPVMQSLLNG